MGNSRYRILGMVIWLPLMVGLSGCAGQKAVSGHWRDFTVTVNGSDDEWQNLAPQYYDEACNLTVRLINDAEALSISFSTRDHNLQRQLRTAGVTVWFDPQRGKETVFGLHLPAVDGDRSGLPGGGVGGPPGVPRRPSDNREPPGAFRTAAIKTFKGIAITYSDTTGPLDMTMDEVRRTGVDIGVGQSGDSRLVCELLIEFSAAPYLSTLKPGMPVGVGIVAASGGPGGLMVPDGGPPAGARVVSAQFGGGMGAPGGGMGMGRLPGNGGPMQKGNSLDVWLKVRLADQGTGMRR